MATYHLRVKDDTKTSGTRVSAKRHVDYILREEGKAHADYINREGAQRDKNDCVFKGNQLPKWAKGSAQKFFSAATRYEDKGNVRYREIELSLPNELTLEQNREIVDTFLNIYRITIMRMRYMRKQENCRANAILTSILCFLNVSLMTWKK